MIKKNTSAFRKPIDRKTEDYVIVKGSKTKAMPEHKNNVKFFPFFFFSLEKRLIDISLQNIIYF